MTWEKVPCKTRDSEASSDKVVFMGGGGGGFFRSRLSVAQDRILFIPSSCPYFNFITNADTAFHRGLFSRDPNVLAIASPYQEHDGTDVKPRNCD